MAVLTRIKNNQVTDASAGNIYLGVNAAAKVQDYSITAGKIANNLTYGSDLTVTGNLTVQGNTTTIDTVNLVVEDPLILLAKEQTGSPTLDIGFIGKRGTSDNIAWVWDESANSFVSVFTTSEVTNTTITISSYAAVTTANLTATTGNFSGNVQVANLSVVGNISGDASFSGNVSASNFLTTGLVSATGNVTGGNVNTGGDVSATGNVNSGNVNTAIVSASGNVTGANLVTGGLITATGNVTGGNVLTGGLISATGNVDSGNVNTGIMSASGNVTGGNLTTAGVVTATGNVTGGNVNTGGAVSATGNVNSGNVNTGIVSASGNVNGTGAVFSGNVTAQYFFGNIAGNIDAAGSNTQVQFNNDDLLGASSNFTFDKATNILAVGGQITSTGAGNAATGTGQIFLNGATLNRIDYNTNGTGAPAFTTRSNGTKVTLYPALSGSTTDYALGIDAATMWYSIPEATSGFYFKWYGATTEVANLSGTGIFSATGNIIGANILTSGYVTATGNVTGGNVNTGGAVSATGNVDSGNVNTGIMSASGNVTGANLVTGGLVTATGNVTGGNVNTGGAVSATGNVNSGNVNTGIMSASGNVTGGNVLTGGLISATGNVSAGNVNTGIVSASGNIVGPNIVTTTVTTSSGDLVLNSAGGALQWDGSGNIVMNSQWINGLSDPVQAFDAATKQYVDDAVSSGIHIHTPVYVETPTALPSATYAQGGNTFTVTDTVAGNTVVFSTVANLQVNDQLWFTNSFNGVVGNLSYFVVSTPNTSAAVLSTAYNGVPVSNITTGSSLTEAVRVNSGIGATLTATANGALVIDSVSVTATQRVLVYQQANAVQNGVYVVTDTGNVTAPWILTRSSDTDTYEPDTSTGLDQGSYFYVQAGATGAGESYVKTAPAGAFIFGYANIEFTQFGASQVYSANTAAGIDLTGTVFSAKVDNDTTAFDGGGNISVKAGANLVTPNIGAATGTSLSVTGNVTGGNLNTGGAVSATGNVNSGNVNTTLVSATGNVNSGNVNTTIVSATGNVIGGNITTAGVVTATGNVTGGNVLTGGLVSATGNIDSGANIVATANVIGGNITTAGVVTATGNVTGGNLVTGGLVQATGNVNSGNVNTTLVSATGNVVAGNVSTAGLVTATGNVTGGNLVTGGEVSATGNVTSGNVNTGIVSATGNVAAVGFTGGNVSVTGNVYAQNFIGNISGNIDAAGANTEVQFNNNDLLAASANFTFNSATNVLTVTGDIQGTTVSATGNVIGGNVSTAGVVTATGNVTGGNVNTGGAVSATGNVDSGNVNTGIMSASGNVIGANISTVGLVTATGNVTGGNVSTAGLVTATGNVTGGNLSTAGEVTATGNVTGGNVSTAGLITATGNVTAANLILTSGTIDGPAAGRITINASDLDTDFAIDGDSTPNIFYVDAGVGTASFGNSGAITNAIVSFNTTDSIKMPVGNTAQRPDPATVGMLRFTTASDALEIYTSTGWELVGVPAFTVITDDQFSGTGACTTFTLSEDSTTAGTIVSINGVVQIPTTAYSVTGNSLVFTEAPEVSDTIDARILTTTTTVTRIENSSGNAVVEVLNTADTVQITGNLLPAANVTYDLGSNTMRWNDAYFNGTSITLGNVIIKNNTGNTIGFFGPDGTTPATIDSTNIDTTTIANGTSNMAVIASGGNIRANVGGSSIITITSGGIINNMGNGVGNIGNSTGYFNTIFAKATSAQYADLAEMYVADQMIEPGTVVCFGGDHEVTICDTDSCSRVAGVISTNPSYIMNAGLAGDHVVAVALTGRVPTRVTGQVRKGDMMVSTADGRARAEAAPTVGQVIGKALADFDGVDGVIEVVVGRL